VPLAKNERDLKIHNEIFKKSKGDLKKIETFGADV
jgi:hypothetical protein